MPKPKIAAASPRKGRGAAHETESVHPKVAVKKERPLPPPKLDESHPFLFTHHHERWIVMGGEVIPGLGKLKLRAGVNGVDENKDGEVIAQHVIDEARANGLVVIPSDVDGEGTSYLVRPKGTNAVISKWERVYSGSTQVDTDVAGYVAWCKSLLDRGIIQPPPPYVLERMKARLVREIEDLADKPNQASYRKRLEIDLDAVERALGEVAPAAELEPVSVPSGKPEKPAAQKPEKPAADAPPAGSAS